MHVHADAKTHLHSPIARCKLGLERDVALCSAVILSKSLNHANTYARRQHRVAVRQR